jgi:hypothetical protein
MILQLCSNAPLGCRAARPRGQCQTHRKGCVPAFTSRRPTAARRQLQQRLVSVRSFEGDAAKALQEQAALDELIDSLLSAKTKQEVGSCSPATWESSNSGTSSSGTGSTSDRVITLSSVN